MARHKNENWSLNDRINSCDEASIAILMDIRDELQALNAKLSCFRVAKKRLMPSTPCTRPA
jgi:hypothetical protein